ncbi:MAG: hypothetical protein IJC93_09660 [Clostridia bacterium]|nr:hypothetical protein [Clostridia bacterium]
MATLLSGSTILYGPCSSYETQYTTTTSLEITVLSAEASVSYTATAYPAYNPRYAFIEYSANSTVRRGYVDRTRISSTLSSNGIGAMPGKERICDVVTSGSSVYLAPSNTSLSLGTLSTPRRVVVLTNGYTASGFSYIEFTLSNGKSRRGYISSSALNTSNPIIPTIDVPSHANITREVYGTSSRGQELVVYKTGLWNQSHTRTVVLVSGQHMFEDAFPADGEGLTIIAKNIIEYLASNSACASLRNNWAIYVVQCANPDALVYGFTNNGHGRTTMGNGSPWISPRDLNRSWPGSSTYTNRRGLNAGLHAGDAGVTTETAPELMYLYNKLKPGTTGAWFTNNSSHTQVMIDMHGWLNYFHSSNDTLCNAFKNAFGSSFTSNTGTDGDCLLSTWMRNNTVVISGLLELPLPTYSMNMASTWTEYSNKVNTALLSGLSALS